MKQLLLNTLINNLESKPQNRSAIFTVSTVVDIGYVINRLNSMHIKDNVMIALVSDNVSIQQIFQIACLLTGAKYIVFGKKDFDNYYAVNLGVDIILTDSPKWLSRESKRKINNSFVKLVIDIVRYNVLYNSIGEEDLAIELDRDMEKKKDEVFNTNVSNVKTLSQKLKDIVNKYSFSMIFVLHPGISSLIPKVSVFTEEQIYEGMFKVINELYPSIKDHEMLSVKHNPVLNIQVLEQKAFPYVLLNGMFLSIFSEGKASSELVEKEYNTILTSSSKLKETFDDIIEESTILSFLERFRLDFLFKLVFSKKFKNRSKDSKLLLLFGKTTKSLRRKIRYTGLKVVYMYNLIEVASFVSFETYNKKFPVSKNPSVGVLPKDVVLNTGSDKNEPAEILIGCKDKFISYTHSEFTQLCSMSNKYVGMHGTLDIGQNVEGKLEVHGKADEIFHNENGLYIQNQLIYSIILDNRFVKDALIITYNNNLLLLVELKLGALLYENKSSQEIMEMLNTKVLPKINKSVKGFSKVKRIYFIPNGFTRINGKIKTTNYFLHEYVENSIR